MRLRVRHLFGGSRKDRSSARRFRVPVIFGASVLLATVVPIGLVGGVQVANAVPSTLGPCTGNLTGTIFTLTAACTTTAQIAVPTTITTIVGGGFTITAHDPTGGNFNGAVLTNTSPGQSMTIENLTIQGNGFAVDCAVSLFGILFSDASGSVSNVKVLDISQHDGCGSGLGIRANAVAGTPRTVTITNTVVSGYNKAALVASGMMTMNVSASTLGPPDRTNPTLLPSQNGVQYGGVGPNAGAGGSVTGSTIYGSGFGNASDQGTAFLLFGAKNVTLSGDTITGAGTDVGVDVSSASTGVVVTRNQIGRTAPDMPDSLGVGVNVEAGSAATVSCNTFSGWQTDIVGATQAVCVTTPSLPGGAVHTPYSATLAAVGGTAPYKWSLASGSLHRAWPCRQAG